MAEDNKLLHTFMHTMIAVVSDDKAPDFTARQTSVFLIVYLVDEAQTVRGLAKRLNVSKPAITRALDRLAEYDLVRRKTDPTDRRSILVQRTARGLAHLRDLTTKVADGNKRALRV